MKPLSKLNKILLSCALCLGVLISGQVTAKEGKEASAAGSVPMARLEAFTVNLSGVDRYLQVNIALQLASPEVAEKIKAYMPVVRHKMIVMLSSKESGELNSLEGKRNLMTEIKETINKALELKERDGVTDVFFENFVIQ